MREHQIIFKRAISLIGSHNRDKPAQRRISGVRVFNEEGGSVYQTILVPLDGSKRAEAILPHVEKLALRFGAHVIFVRIEEDVVNVGYDALVDLSAIRGGRDQLKKAAESYLAGLEEGFHGKRIHTQQRVCFGPVVQSILDAAEREDADLVAMASHGQKSLSRVFYGSVAAGVLNGMQRPLLIIRSRDTD
jgi:nucleotide-binding universal stress UspA family protein